MIGRNNKKGYALLVGILISLFFGIFIGVSFIRSSSLGMRGVVSRKAQDALYIAETGLQRVVANLREDMAWPGLNAFEPLQASTSGPIYGYYRPVVDHSGMVVEDSWSLIPVTVTGQDAAQTATCEIQAKIRARSIGSFFIVSASDLTIESGAEIGADILGRSLKFATLQTGQNITIQGTASYVHQIAGYDPENPDATPGITIGGEAKKISRIAFPSIDPVRYEGLAAEGGYVHNGDLSINGASLSRQYNFGNNQTASNGIIYVKGNVYINATILESLAIVATGNIYINGDIEYDTQNPQSNIQLGLFSQNNIILQGPSQDGGTRRVEALLFAEKRIKSEKNGNNATLQFNGSIAARGDFSTVQSAIDLSTAFASRAYTYDTRLSNPFTCNIPAMSYIADIVDWSVVGDPSVVVDTY